MASENGVTENGAVAAQAATKIDEVAADSKGKGKAVASEKAAAHDTTMDEDDDEDEEDEADDNAEAEDADEEEDGMDEIDLENVIGRRTRGKVIDFAKAAEEQNLSVDDDDEDEDDDDFEDPEDKMDED